MGQTRAFEGGELEKPRPRSAASRTGKDCCSPSWGEESNCVDRKSTIDFRDRPIMSDADRDIPEFS
ncbi:MAG: hypothetical protein OEM42_07215, partial [Deltaproteobacteria bacterium]|nr:hypothetical protein [Deltaproteobacteria bacterium]